MMTMKRLSTLISILLLGIGLHAQQGRELTGSAREEAMQTILTATQQVKSIQCDFRQTKSSAMLTTPTEARGTMHYEAPDKLRWTYTEPTQYALEVDGESVALTGVNGKANRLMKPLGKLILTCINGSQLFDERIFQSQIFDNGATYEILLTSKRKDMQRIFTGILFVIDKKSLTVQRIRLDEKSGDNTLIQFQNIQVK